MTVTIDSGTTLPAADEITVLKEQLKQVMPRIVATRGCFPVSNTASGGSNLTRWESAVAIKSGKSGASDIRLIYSNRLPDGSTSETFEALAPFTLESSIVDGATYQPITFNGNRLQPVTNGTPLLLSDTTSCSLINPNTEVWVKTAYVVPAPVTFIQMGMRGGGTGNTTKTRKMATALTASRIFNATIIDSQAGYSTTTFAPCPVAVIGVPNEPQVSILGWGDSITSGQGDGGGNALGHIGWLERACTDIGGFSIPFANLSRGGERTVAYTPVASPARFALLKYATHVVFALGHNDISAGLSLASMQANHQTAWAAAKAAGCKVYAMTITPKTTSTDGWVTIANQTPEPAFRSTGLRGQFNAWLYTQVGLGLLDGVIDTTTALSPVGQPDVFLPNMTLDGVHPNPAGYIAMSNAAIQTISTFKP